MHSCSLLLLHMSFVALPAFLHPVVDVATPPTNANISITLKKVFMLIVCFVLPLRLRCGGYHQKRKCGAD